MVGAVGEEIADSISRNAFVFGTAFPFVLGAIARSMSAKFLVGSIAAIVLAVAHARLRDANARVVALEPARMTTVGFAQRRVLVAAVAAVVFPVAKPQFGDAKSVVASKLGRRTGFVAVEFIGTVSAICGRKKA